MILSFINQNDFKAHHLYDGRTVGAIALSGLFYYMVLFASDDKKDHSIWIFKASAVLTTSLILSSLYLYKSEELKKELIQQSGNLSGIIEWDDFALLSTKFKHASTHWNAEMFSVLIQHFEGQPVKIIVRKHPDFEPTFYDNFGKEKFFETLKKLSVTFDGKIQ